MAKPKILAFVMAGGEGTRLYPLTSERSKPSVPFGARYRIVDFVLSNLINSGIHAIYLLVQYKSQSLIEHVRKAWVLPPILPEHFVTIVPPQMRSGPEWFQGTADAVYQNLNLLRQHSPDLVLVFGADHIYRMDVQQMVRFHREREADVSVAALPVPASEARAFGVIGVDKGGRINSFVEKPQTAPTMPDRPTHVFASMGNYIFNTDVLVSALEDAHSQAGHDFGRNVLPELISRKRIYAYNFADNRVPGVKVYEEPAYWRDVGTLESYFAANMDGLGTEPRFDVFNARWPIHSSSYQGPVAKFHNTNLDNSIVSAGCMINGATVRNSILRREVVLEPDVELEDCIIMDYVVVRRGAKLRRVIVDRYNVIEQNERIGFSLAQDRTRFHLAESGIVVIPAPRHDRDAGSSFGEVS